MYKAGATLFITQSFVENPAVTWPTRYLDKGAKAPGSASDPLSVFCRWACSAAPAPSCDGTAEEHAKRIIDVVVADNPIGRRAAR